MTKMATLADKIAIENQSTLAERQASKTVYQYVARAADRFPGRNALSFQITSGVKDKAETLTWTQVLGKVTQAANMFRRMGVGENDVVAYLLPNANETAITLWGAQSRASLTRSIRCSRPNRSAQSCVKPMPRFW